MKRDEPDVEREPDERSLPPVPLPGELLPLLPEDWSLPLELLLLVGM